MQIKNLKINQFRGVGGLEFSNFGDFNSFCGANGIGKTTALDCIMWLLCDETYTYGVQNEDNKNKNSQKDTIDVEMTLTDSQNNEYVLHREYFEKWKDGEFIKNENKFEINGAKYSVSEYLYKIRNIIGLNKDIKTKKFNILRAVMDYSYIETIDYKIARDFIEEILGIISDDEILQDQKFACIINGLKQQQTKENKYDLIKTKSQFKNTFDKKSNEIDNLKIKLKTKENELDLDKIDKMQDLIKEREEIYNLKIENNNDYKAIINLIAENDKNIELEEKTLSNEYNEQKTKVAQLLSIGKELRKNQNQYSYEIARLKLDISSAENGIKLKKEKMLMLREKYNDVNNSNFVSITCPKCNSLVNENEANQFKNDKEEKLLGIKQEAESVKQDIDILDKKIKAITSQINALENDSNDLEKEIKVKAEKYIEENQKLSQLEEKLNEMRVNSDLGKKGIDLLVKRDTLVVDFNKEKMQKIEQISHELGTLENMKALQTEIETIKEQIAQLNKEKAYAELQLQMLEEFKQLKLKLTRENTNKVFPNIEFEMLETSATTGAIQECCYPKYKNVEFNGVNSGNKYPLGIEVIENIKSALGITEDLPILIDKLADLDKKNLEKCLSLTNAQIIGTLVTNDNKIKLNITNKENK